MAIFANKNGNTVRVSKYDTVNMLTLRDLFPGNKDKASIYLIKKETAPAGALKNLYGVQDNSALVRKIFREYLYNVLDNIAEGKYAFELPNVSKSLIYLGYMKDEVVQYKAQKGHLEAFDLLASGFKVPYLTYNISSTKKRQELQIYVPKSIHKSIVKVANNNEKPSKIPYKFKKFMPFIHELYHDLEPVGLNKLVFEMLREMGKRINEGHEIRIVWHDGEIRFFRPLGRIHDKVMRKVHRKYKENGKNKKYGK